MSLWRDVKNNNNYGASISIGGQVPGGSAIGGYTGSLTWTNGQGFGNSFNYTFSNQFVQDFNKDIRDPVTGFLTGMWNNTANAILGAGAYVAGLYKDEKEKLNNLIEGNGYYTDAEREKIIKDRYDNARDQYIRDNGIGIEDINRTNRRNNYYQLGRINSKYLNPDNSPHQRQIYEIEQELLNARQSQRIESLNRIISSHEDLSSLESIERNYMSAIAQALEQTNENVQMQRKRLLNNYFSNDSNSLLDIKSLDERVEKVLIPAAQKIFVDKKNWIEIFNKDYNEATEMTGRDTIPEIKKNEAFWPPNSNPHLFRGIDSQEMMFILSYVHKLENEYLKQKRSTWGKSGNQI